jgi:hypothetical protein
MSYLPSQHQEQDYDEENDDDVPDEANFRSTQKWRQPFQRKVMTSAIIAVVCVVSAYAMFSQIGDAADGVEHRLFDAPEMHRMLLESARPVLGATMNDEELSGHIKNTIKHLKERADTDLPQDQAAALKNAQLTPQQWQDLGQTARASRDRQVHKAGLLALQVLRANLFSSEKVIAEKMKEALTPYARSLIKLRSQVVTEHMDVALNKWAQSQQGETHGAWRGLLDSPSVLQPIRDGEAPSRRLALGVGGTPVGVLSVVLVMIGEILVHVDMFVPNFSIPQWAWKLIMTPAEVTTALACTNGANAYCNTIMGTMGVNVLDAAYVTFCTAKLFGAAASSACLDVIHSVPEQEKMVDTISGALGGGDVFNNNRFD